MNRGFLLAELLISCALFIAVSTALGMLLVQSELYLRWSTVRIDALVLAGQQVEKIIEMLRKDFDSTSPTFYTEGNYDVITSIIPVDNYTKKVEISVSYPFGGKRGVVNLSHIVTDTRESEGQSSCRPDQDRLVWEYPIVSSFDLNSLGVPIVPSDIDLVGTYAYIASDSATASDPDLFIYDVSDMRNIRLVGRLDTGPGIEALQVAGNYVYVANTSINAQLQIIEIKDIQKPKIVSSYKLPGAYGSSTPTGTAIFYKSGNVFLGTTKSDIDEMHYIDVFDPLHPQWIDGEEIGNGVNDIFAFKEKVYIASPHKDELKVFTFSSSGQFIPFISYNDPGATGNGKRLSLFLDTLFLGKTKTFSKEELLVLRTDTSRPSVSFRFPLGVSVHGLIGYGGLLFTLLNRPIDGFIIFDIASSTSSVPMRQNRDHITFSGSPLNFDCDEDIFAVISQGTSIITFITNQ